MYGRALEDEDFTLGTDSIRYSFDIGDATGPFTLHVELLYQPLAPSWVEDLRQVSGDEVARFLRMYEMVPNRPVVVAAAESDLNG